MIDHTIENFKGWDDVVDYESDENEVILINSTGEKIAKFGYRHFTKEDFDRFKRFSSKHFRVRIGESVIDLVYREFSKGLYPGRVYKMKDGQEVNWNVTLGRGFESFESAEIYLGGKGYDTIKESIQP